MQVAISQKNSFDLLDAKGKDYPLKNILTRTYRDLTRIENYLLRRPYSVTHEVVWALKFALGAAFEVLEHSNAKNLHRMPREICRAMKTYLYENEERLSQFFLLRRHCKAINVDYNQLINDYNTIIAAFDENK